MKTLVHVIVLAAALVVATFVPVGATTAAEKRILRLVVPTPPGSSADVMARILADHMSATLGASLIVENRPGASGVIAVESVLQQVAASPALLIAGLDHIVYGPAALGRQAWDPFTDLKPVGLVNNDRWVIAGNIATAADLQSARRTATERPLRCANLGLGTTQHAVCAWAAKRIGVEVDHIPYRQPYLPDLIGGRVDIAAMPVPGAAVALNAGRVKGLFILSRDRHPSFKDIPTSVELGLNSLLFESGLALYVVPGTSDHDVERFHDALQRAQSDEAIRRRFVELGVDTAPASRAEAEQQLRARLRLGNEIRREALGTSR